MSLPPKPLTVAQAKRRMGGAFPRVKGTKYRYPVPSNESAWTSLVNRARQWEYKERQAFLAGKPPPKCACKSKYQYILHHASPRERKRRSLRNQHRAALGLKKGDKRVVHHRDRKNLSLESTEVLTRCQHKKIHGQRCLNNDK